MISEKKYLRLMKQLLVQKPSKDFNSIVLEKCGLSEHKLTSSKPTFLSEINYSIACLILIVTIFIVSFMQSTPNEKPYLIIAANSKIFVSQLISGTYYAFTDSK